MSTASTVFWIAVTPTVGQAQGGRTPRTADGKPNLNGIWQSLNTANWDLEGHAAKAGPVVALGASFSEPAGLSDAARTPFELPITLPTAWKKGPLSWSTRWS